jgi:hypothetical protein
LYEVEEEEEDADYPAEEADEEKWTTIRSRPKRKNSTRNIRKSISIGRSSTLKNGTRQGSLTLAAIPTVSGDAHSACAGSARARCNQRNHRRNEKRMTKKGLKKPKSPRTPNHSFKGYAQSRDCA